MSDDTVVAVVIFSGIPVKCSGCGGWFHELTERYSPEDTLRGSHLRLNSTYKGYGWYDFPHEDWVVGENVMCPQCMRPYRGPEVAAQVTLWLEKAQEVQNGLKNAENEAESGEEKGGAAEDEESSDGNSAPPETIGDLAVPGVVGVGADGADLPSSGNNGDGGAVSIPELVRNMSWDGSTQAEIAETCGISVYMVREIQNGRKV